MTSRFAKSAGVAYLVVLFALNSIISFCGLPFWNSEPLERARVTFDVRADQL